MGPSTVYFRNFNRGKKSVVLNLKDPADREALLGLCDGADVFVETFRPGVMDRLGIGYAQLAARNPRIVYCSISAFGQSGPYRDRPSHDLGVEAVSGVLSVSEGRDGQPAIPAVAAADMVASLQGLAGILMALLRRQTTGQGDYLDISMHDSVVSASANLLGPALAEDRQQNAKHERTTGGSAFYQIYDTKDGRHVALAGQEMKFVHNLLGALGRPELAALCERGPGPHQQPVEQFLRETFRYPDARRMGRIPVEARRLLRRVEDLSRGAARPAPDRARHGPRRWSRAQAPRLADTLRARARQDRPPRARHGRAWPRDPGRP